MSADLSKWPVTLDCLDLRVLFQMNFVNIFIHCSVLLLFSDTAVGADMVVPSGEIVFWYS